MEEYLTMKQACKMLGIKSYKALNTYIKSGLPAIVVGNSKRIGKQDLVEFMNEHKTIRGVKRND